MGKWLQNPIKCGCMEASYVEQYHYCGKLIGHHTCAEREKKYLINDENQYSIRCIYETVLFQFSFYIASLNLLIRRPDILVLS